MHYDKRLFSALFLTLCRPSNSELSSAMVKLMPSHHPAKILTQTENKSVFNRNV
jgi:hypothetical protein